MNPTEQAMIKVCGMREHENIKALCEQPIDMIGFIFYDKSPRYVGPMKDRGAIAKHIPPHIFKTGVFVNQSLQEVRNEIASCSLDIVQLHGEESPAYCQQLSGQVEVIKAFSIDADFDFDLVKAYECCRYFLFDTKGKHAGGNGYQFDWSLLEKYQGPKPFLLSGGIGPDDTKALLDLKHPYLAGFDLNSKFETVPGRKNIQLVEQFIQAFS